MVAELLHDQDQWASTRAVGVAVGVAVVTAVAVAVLVAVKTSPQESVGTAC